MDRLELSLGLEVLGFRVVPPLSKTTKGEGYKFKGFFYFVSLCFSLRFVSFFLFAFVLHLSSFFALH